MVIVKRIPAVTYTQRHFPLGDFVGQEESQFSEIWLSLNTKLNTFMACYDAWIALITHSIIK